jgi:hypothetical protein
VSTSESIHCFAALTFEEGLELYDLLEMDVEGDTDPEVRFDDTSLVHKTR